MTPERLDQIEALYLAARALSTEDRAALLAQADPELRSRVESLLATGDTLQIPEDSTITELTSGACLGPYRIETKLGEGGMGAVFRAVDTRLGRAVAVKIAHQRFGARFEREGRAISSLNHPNICTLFDVGPNYLVMELVEGETIAALLKRGPLPSETALRYAAQIAAALAEAHSKGMVHRDLKPGNIMIAKSGVKVLDFGLAKLEQDETVTASHMVLGTPAYMPPEQREGKPADARSDIYSFGCVLYEMLSGRRAGSQRQPLAARGLEKVVSRCLEQDPARRWQTAAELERELAATTGISQRWKVIVPAAAVVLALIAAGYFYFHRAPKLTDKDTIVLADFKNTTGDSVFDGTLRQGLAIQLEQSPFLSLLSDESIHQTLGLMGRPADAPLTPEIAREICERAAGAAVLDGSINSLGSAYVVGLRAKNCHTGTVLDEEQVQAARKEDVLNALGQIASKFRTRVGESLATVEKHSTPLAEATTPSIDALKEYSTALKVLYSSGDAAAVPLFKRATEIDPKFAMAYANLGSSYGGIGESELSVANVTKAWQLRDRTTDAEKFSISAAYDLNVTGNMEKARQTFESWAQIYPRAYDAPGLLSGQIYPVLGQYEKAIEAARKAIALNPDVPFAYVNLATAYQFLDRPAEAEAAFRQMSERKLEFPDSLMQRYQLAFVKGDQAEMEQQVVLAKERSGMEAEISKQQAFVLAYSGRLQQARKMSGSAVDLARQAAAPERAALAETGAALREAFFGNAPAATRDAAEALALSMGRDVEYGAGLALALAGDSSRAQTLANDLDKRFTEDTSVRFSYLPELRALLALQPPLNQKSDAAKAIELLQVAVPYELGVPLSWFSGFGAMYPVYLRGEAFLAAGQGAEAAAEFQKILDHRAIVATDCIGALAHLQLGRAFHLSGDDAKAKTAYQDFLTLWQEADADIPILLRAKTEYSKLQ